MSLPVFPDHSNTPNREEVINQIISSIAMEELALSHILNAEGEKLQYVLGTLNDNNGLRPSIDEIIKVNDSVKDLIEAVMFSQMFLRAKLKDALSMDTEREHTHS
ncbi:MAG: hypothetical protein FWC16_07810 [Defluviitaleaceae bacterium]|nr:hypothetical protein [Defluviitaleaceae bacterium]MCL2274820.1 hypothetical protein [Defluviitaleaceae bacterium]